MSQDQVRARAMGEPVGPGAYTMDDFTPKTVDRPSAGVATPPVVTDLEHVRRQRDGYRDGLLFQSERAYKANMRALDLEQERDHWRARAEHLASEKAEADMRYADARCYVKSREEVGRTSVVGKPQRLFEREFPCCEGGDHQPVIQTWTPTVGERVSGRLWRAGGRVIGEYGGSCSDANCAVIRDGNAGLHVDVDSLRPAPPAPRQWTKGDAQPEDVSVVTTADGGTWTKLHDFGDLWAKPGLTEKWVYWHDLLAIGVVTEAAPSPPDDFIQRDIAKEREDDAADRGPP